MTPHATQLLKIYNAVAWPKTLIKLLQQSNGSHNYKLPDKFLFKEGTASVLWSWGGCPPTATDYFLTFLIINCQAALLKEMVT